MNFLFFVPYIVLFPYACFGYIHRAQKNGHAIESLFWSASVALLNTFLVATLLAITQSYRYSLLLIILYLEVLLVFILAAKMHLLYSPRTLVAKLKASRFHILPTIILVVAFVLYALFPVSHLLGGRDSGLYPLNAIHISREGGIFYQSDDFLNEHYEEYQEFISLGYPGLYSDLESKLKNPGYLSYLFGEYFSDPQPGDINAQFMPGFSALLAVGYDIGGLPILIRVNAVVSVFSLLAFYYFVRRFFGEKPAFFSLLFLAFSPAQIWASRITLTEIFAQLLFFLSCYLFASGWKHQEKCKSALGGLILGLSLMVRMDAYIYGLGLLFIAAYCALFDRKSFRFLRPGIVLYALLGFFTIIWGLFYTRSYFTQHLGTGSLKLITLANLALLLLVVLCDLLGVLLSKHASPKDYLSEAFASQKGALGISGLFLIAFLFLYFVRPILPHGTKDSSIFAARSMIELCWYVSIPAVLLSIYGLYCFLRHRRKETSILLLFFALGISNLMIYLLWPSITPDHIWASRRWISVCIPFLFILAGYGLCNFRFRKLSIWWVRAIQATLCLLVSGYLLYQSVPFLFSRALSGINEQYEATVAAMDEDTVYFSHSTELASYLRFVYGQNVYLMQYDQDSAAVESYLAQNKKLHYVGSHPYTFLNPFHCEVSRQSYHNISGLYLEKTISSYPRKMVQAINPSSIYTISAPNVPIQRVSLPLDLFISQNNVSSDASIFRSDGSERYLFFGPYLRLDAGNYAAEITLKLINGSGRIAIADYCFGGETAVKTTLMCKDFSADGTYTLNIPIVLSRDVQDFELRLIPVFGTVIEVSHVSLIKNG